MGNCCSKKKKLSVIQALTVVDNNTSSASNVQGTKKEEIQAKSKQINNEVTKAERKRSENPKEINKSSVKLIAEDVTTKFTLVEFTYRKNDKDLLKNEILKTYKYMTNLHELRNFPYIEENELNIKTLDDLKEMYYQIYFSDIFLKNYSNGFYKEDVNFNKIKNSENLNDMYLAIKCVINENNQVFLEKLKQNDKNDKPYDDIVSVKDKIITLASDYQNINSIRVENEEVKKYLDKKDAMLNGLNKDDPLTVQIKIKRLISHMEEEDKKSRNVKTVTSFPSSSSKKKKVVDLSESENEDDVRNTYGELF